MRCCRSRGDLRLSAVAEYQCGVPALGTAINIPNPVELRIVDIRLPRGLSTGQRSAQIDGDEW